MSKPHFLSENQQKHRNILGRPTSSFDLHFEEVHNDSHDLYEDNEPWQFKARRLQARRWRKIRHQLV